MSQKWNTTATFRSCHRVHSIFLWQSTKPTSKSSGSSLPHKLFLTEEKLLFSLSLLYYHFNGTCSTELQSLVSRCIVKPKKKRTVSFSPTPYLGIKPKGRDFARAFNLQITLIRDCSSDCFNLVIFKSNLNKFLSCLKKSNVVIHIINQS